MAAVQRMAAHEGGLDEAGLAPTLEPLLQRVGGSARAAFDQLAAMQFRYVQLSATAGGLRPRDLDRSARRDVLATLRRAELVIAGLDVWIPPQHFLDQARVDRAIHAMHAVIELAADFGRCPVSFALPAATNVVQDRDEPKAQGFVLDALAAMADRFGVLLADHAVPVAQPTRPAALGIGVDPAAWLSHNLDPAAAVHNHGQRLFAARLCDLLHTGLRGPIGTRVGRLDVAEYKVALSVARYRRPIVIDARHWTDPWGGLEETREMWRRATSVV